MRKFIYTDWSEVHEQTWKLGKIVELAFQPEVIIAIARGGLVVGRVLADYFSLMKLYTVNIESAGIQTYRVAVPRICLSSSLDVQDCSVLVVDEVSNSGYSLQSAERFAYHNGARVVKTAVLIYKTPECVVRPDFFTEECSEDVWHTYPWAIAEDLGYIARQDTHISTLYATGHYSEIQRYLENEYHLILSDSVVQAVLKKVLGDNCP